MASAMQTTFFRPGAATGPSSGQIDREPKLNETMAAGILRQIAIRNGLDPAVAYAHADPMVDFSPAAKTDQA